MLYRRILWCIVFLALIGVFLAAEADAPPEVSTEYRPGIAEFARTQRVDQIGLTQTYPPAPPLMDWSHYPTASEVRVFAEWLVATYPNLVSLAEMGSSWQGRPLYVLTLAAVGVQAPDDRPALYVDAQHHAREAISQQAALYLVWWLVQSYGEDPYITHLLATRTLYVFPQVNPDGNEIWLGVDVNQRKTVSPTCDDDGDGSMDEDPPELLGLGSHDRYLYGFEPAWVAEHPDDVLTEGWPLHWLSSVYLGLYGADDTPAVQLDNDGDGHSSEDPYGGVDPNRNYDWYWGSGDARVSSESYRGSQPFSEPETQAVRDWIMGHGNIATAISLHSGADMILYPWAWTDSQQSPQHQQLDAIAHKGSELTACHGYAASAFGQGSVALYRATGTTFDWLHAQGIWSWTPEIYGGDYYVFADRVPGTSEYVVGRSISGLFAPAPGEIMALADRWRRFFVYVLAATPNMSVSSVAASETGLWLQVANDGYLPMQVGLCANSCGEIYTATVSASAGREWLHVPYDLDRCAAGGIITLTGTVEVAGQRRVIEEQTWHVAAGLPGHEADLFIQGVIEPWMDLGRMFGPDGWEASDTPASREHSLPMPHPDRYLPLVLALSRG